MKNKETPVFPIVRKRSLYNTNDNPWHITGEYGCQYSDTVSGWREELNLVKLAFEPVYTHSCGGYWKTGQRSSMMDFTDYINLFFCSFCESTIKYWHTQRQIFLPLLAEHIELPKIDEYSFTAYEEQQGDCDVCGTPESAIAELPFDISPYGVDPPFQLCFTCRDLLINASSTPIVEQKPLSEHPHTTPEFTPNTPITDPQYKHSSATQLPDNPYSSLRDLRRNTFIYVIRSFKYTTLSRNTAKRLLNAGYSSIPELAETSPETLQKIDQIGPTKSEQIVDGANDYLEKYIQAVEETGKTNPQQLTINDT